MAFNSKYTGAQVEALLDKVNTGVLDVWLPSVDTSGNLSWTKSASSTVPTTRNIKGPTGPTGPAGSFPVISLTIDESDQSFNDSVFTAPGIYSCDVTVTNRSKIQLSSGKGLAVITAITPDLVGVLLYGNQYISLTGRALDDASWGLSVLNGPLYDDYGFFQEFNPQI